MARKFYTCIIVPNASQQLHKLRVPVQALYLLVSIGLLSFFVVVGLGFHYVGMASKVGDMKNLQAENASLRVDTQQLRLETAQLTQKVAELENEAEAISKAIQEDPLLRKLGPVRPSMGGTTANVPTDELSSSPDGSIEALRERMDDLIREYQYLDDKTTRMRSTPTIWPLVGRIGSHFGGRLDPFTGDADTHLGIDISAPRGAPIKATADGVVHFARRAAEYGNLIVLKHPNGFTTRYGHLSAFKVTVDQTVRKGDVIGYVGMTGRTTAPHLHYEVRLNDHPVNPRPYLRWHLPVVGYFEVLKHHPV